MIHWPLPEGHRDLLVATLRGTARWRRRKALEYDDKHAQKRSHRTMVALSVAAKFVEEMDETDADLSFLRHVESEPGRERLALSEESLALVSRFGMDQGAWAEDSKPTEAQIRNLLRRVAGAESRERAAQRRDAT